MVGEEEGQQDREKVRKTPVLWEFGEGEGKEKKRTLGKNPQGPVMVNLFCCQKNLFFASGIIADCDYIVGYMIWFVIS